MRDSMSWATKFLQRLCCAYGTTVVKEKIEKWKWSCSTCFSGIGCAETARVLKQASLLE